MAPISIALPTHLRKPPRRKYKKSSKAWSKPATDAITHPQEIRHPAQTLQHLTPSQTQIVLRTADPPMKEHRDKLIRQIAFLRSVRTNITPRNILLEQVNDDNFLTQVQTRIEECLDPPNCTVETQIDIPLSTIQNRDELQVRGAICYAWIDLTTRAILPSLYDAWPDQPIWNGTPLVWLQATDPEVPCLQDESLAYLAACPSLQEVWSHISKDTPELDQALQTAANQWRLFKTKQDTHGTMSASHTTNQ